MADEAPLSFRRPPDSRRVSVGPPPPIPAGPAAEGPAGPDGVGPEDGVFRRKTAVILVAATAFSLIASLVYGVLADDLADLTSHKADSYSRSALGHHALVQFFESEGVDVLVSRAGSGARAGPQAPLLIAEPILLDAKDESLDGTPLVNGLREIKDAAAKRRGPVIVVLPKWDGSASAERQGWVGPVVPIDAVHVSDVLWRATDTAEDSIRIVRVPLEDATWHNELGGSATPLTETAQLVGPHEALTPLIWTDQGSVIAQVTGQQVFLITDPDLLNTAGLGRGQNAEVLAELVRDHLGAESLVVDETLHGYFRPPSIWRELLTFPLLLVTLHVLLLLALALWATIGRYGKPDKVPPRLAPGKQAIVESTAALLVAGEHHGQSLLHYYKLRLHQAAHACALPQGLSPDELRQQLGQLGRSRGATEDLDQLAREVGELSEVSPSPQDCVRMASRLHQHFQEIQSGHR